MAMLSLLKLILISTGLTCVRTRTSMGGEAIVVRVHDGGVEDPVHLDEPRGGGRTSLRPPLASRRSPCRTCLWAIARLSLPCPYWTRAASGRPRNGGCGSWGRRWLASSASGQRVWGQPRGVACRDVGNRSNGGEKEPRDPDLRERCRSFERGSPRSLVAI